MRRRTIVLTCVAVVLASSAITWAVAHRFYMKKFMEQFASSQLQVITSGNLPLRGTSPAVVGTDRIADPSSGSYTYWKMDVDFEKHGATAPERSARASLDLTADPRYGKPIDLRGKRILLFYQAPKSLQGTGRHLNRMQVELHDVNDKVMRGPFQAMVLTDRMMPLEFRPYTDIPIPLGYMETGFDLTQVRSIGLRLRVDDFANLQVPRFYPAKGSIIVSPIFIAPNVVAEGAQHVFASSPSKHTGPVQNPVPEFVVGINYPWRNYGWDFGKNPWNPDPDAHDGLSKHPRELARDFAHLRKSGVSVIRVFMFCDLRTGLQYDENKKLVGFDKFVADDVRALLETARVEKVRLVLSLFNFDLADGIEFNGSGEHQELITDPVARAVLMEQGLTPLFKMMAPYEDVIYAMEPMNEPEHALFLTNHENFAKHASFLEEIALLSRKHLPNTATTNGSANRQLLTRFWMDFPSDIHQFHYYRNMEDEEGVPYDYPAAQISRDKPVIFGEVQGDDPYGRLESARKNGYAGVLFWSLRAEDGYDVDLQEIRRWTQDNRPTDLE